MASARTGSRVRRSSSHRGPSAGSRPTIASRSSARARGSRSTELLDELARLRADNLQTLTGWRLTDAELALTGEHPEFGTVTLRQLLATWVAHDLGHLSQVTRVMAKQYRDAIGPWHAYLSIMSR